MTTPVACVIVADRHPTLLAALKRVLEPQFEVIAMVDNVISLIDALGAHEPDAIVLGLSVNDKGGNQLVRHLARAHPTIPIVLVGDNPEENASPDERLACRYVPKSRTRELLREAIATAIEEFSARGPRDS